MAGSAGAIRAGRAYVELGVDDKQLQKGLDDASAKLKQYGAGIAAVGAAIAAFGAAGLAFFGAAINRWVEGGNALYELSKRTGASVEALSTLGYAAEHNGVSTEALSMAFRRMSREIDMAAQGSAAAQQALAELGVTAAELKALSPEDAFRLLGGRLGDLTDAFQRASLAQTFFGRTGTQLLPLFAEGADGLAKMEKKARDLGLVTSEESAKGAHEFGNALKDLWAVGNKIVSTIGGALGPQLKTMVETITNGVAAVLTFVKANREWVPLIAATFAGLTILGVGLGAVGVAIIALGALLGSLVPIAAAAAAAISALWLAITTPGLVIAAVVIGAAAAFLYFSGTATAALQAVANQFSGLGETVMTVWGGIKEAMAGGDLVLAAKIAWAGIKLAVLENTQGLQLAWADVVATFKSTWIVLVDTLTNLWAGFVNKVIGMGIDIKVTIASILNALGAVQSAKAIFASAVNVGFAKGVSPEETVNKLLGVEQERQAAPDAMMQRIFDERAELQRLLGDAHNAALEAAQKQEAQAGDVASVAKVGGELGTAVSRGTFNPSVVGALTGGDKLSGVEEHTKSSAKSLKSIDKKIDQLGVEFDA